MALGLMRHKQRLTRVTVRELLKVGLFFSSMLIVFGSKNMFVFLDFV